MLEGPDGQVEHTAATGQRPGQRRSTSALRKALSKFYPRGRAASSLLDYKVRVLGGADGDGGASCAC